MWLRTDVICGRGLCETRQGKRFVSGGLPVPTPFREEDHWECGGQGPVGAGGLSWPGGLGSQGSPRGTSAGPEAQGKAGGGDHRPPGGARSSPGTHVGGPPGPGWRPA